MSNFRVFCFRFLPLILLCACLLGCASETAQAPAAEPAAPEPVSESLPVSQPAEKEPEPPEPEAVFVDVAAKVKLNMNSESLKQKVTVKGYVDGDTTHFYVPESVVETGVLKARYLAINTPESTGKVEEYGKTAAAFTREKLEAASSIVIESDDGSWNLDSTSTRYLVWVWYRTAESDDYRNLNVEILQNGLAIASSSAQNRYGSYCMEALTQARNLKLNIYSGEKDPNFFYGDAVELTLKELRLHVAEYEGMKVAFEANLIRNSSNTVYAEEYDPETGLYVGIPVYYGFNLSGDGLNILTVGNRVRIVGTVQYYEAGDSWQISGVGYKAMRPDDPGNLQKLGTDYLPAYPETDADTLLHGTVVIASDEGTAELPYSDYTIGSSVSMTGLRVLDIVTTEDEESSSKNAMTMTCAVGDTYVTVRTTVLYDENRNVIAADAYRGKLLSVRGLVDRYNGNAQIKVFSAKDITIIEE